jgi:hypothetical protein
MMSVRGMQNPLETPDLGVTVEEAISFIVEALKDPYNPRWCAPCIVSCILIIRLHHQSVGGIVKRNHSLCSSVVSFVTAKRSAADIEALDAHWARCECSQIDTRGNNNATAIHAVVSGLETTQRIVASDPNHGQDEAIGRFGNEIDVIGAVFHNLVQFLDHALRKAKAFSIAKGRHPEIWPATPKDVIPYGVKLLTGIYYQFLIRPYDRCGDGSRIIGCTVTYHA